MSGETDSERTSGMIRIKYANPDYSCENLHNYMIFKIINFYGKTDRIILQINYLVIFTTLYEFSRKWDGDENEIKYFNRKKRLG